MIAIRFGVIGGFASLQQIKVQEAQTAREHVLPFRSSDILGQPSLQK